VCLYPIQQTGENLDQSRQESRPESVSGKEKQIQSNQNSGKKGGKSSDEQ